MGDEAILRITENAKVEAIDSKEGTAESLATLEEDHVVQLYHYRDDAAFNGLLCCSQVSLLLP